ncbi:hypothetical protein WN48_11354 [Eufriesea mexicana]|uniref:Uncharacterized protein n=1 Tax=Eufriesea mexicana TaxID=516756 RepID=A0A310SI50_9HYME|nr:hypothetical protein WN48_11354 [Eufriesea mexicana]
MRGCVRMPFNVSEEFSRDVLCRSALAIAAKSGRSSFTVSVLTVGVLVGKNPT